MICGSLSPRRASIPADVEIIRSQIISNLRRATTSPSEMASLRWWQTAFADHPYGRPVDGTLETVPAISIDDLKAYSHRVLARVESEDCRRRRHRRGSGEGDARPRFRRAARSAGACAVADVSPQGLGRRIVVKLDVPQAVIMFGGPGIARQDPDFMAAYIVNHILGGGSFSSRLYQEVREKRGLAYSVSDSLVWLNHTALFLGGTATRSDRASETLDYR